MTAYIKFVLQLLRDVARAFPSRTIWSQVYQLLAAILSLVAGGFAFIILLSFEKGQIDVFGNTIRFEATDGRLILAFSVIGVLALSRVMLDFLSVFSINRLCRLYEEFNVVRGFRKIDAIDLMSYVNLNADFDRRAAFRLVQADARFAATAQRMLLRTIVPAISFVIGAGILLVVNPLSIAILAGFVLVSIIPLWLISRRAFHVSSRFENEAARVSSLKSETLDNVLQRSSSRTDAKPHYDDLPHNPSMKSFMDMFELRFNVIAQAGVASGFLSAIVVAIVTGVFAWQALRGNMAWSFVILHFVALQFIFQAIQRITALFVSMNRFYTQLKRYFEFVGREEQAPPDDERAPARFPVTLHSRPDGRFSIELDRGGRAFVVAGAPLDRFSLYGLLAALNVHENEAARFLREPSFCPSTSAQTHSDGVPNQHLVTADRILEMTSTDGGQSKTNGAGETASVREEQARLRNYLARCLELAGRKPPVCFLDQRILNRLQPAQMEMLLEYFAESFVFVFALRNLQPARTWGFPLVVVFNGQCVTGVMTMDEALADRSRLMALTEERQPDSTDIPVMAEPVDFD